MAELDMANLRELACELGYWPATTHPEDIERHRRLNRALDAALDLEKTKKKFAHLHLQWCRAHGEASPEGRLESLAPHGDGDAMAACVDRNEVCTCDSESHQGETTRSRLPGPI
jgi:hypothetical protein